MKLSFHNQRGGRHALHGYRPWHNDGSMYRDDTERFERGRKMNGHWDMFMYGGPYEDGQAFISGGKQVGMTCKAVDQFYENTIRSEYDEKCASTSWKKNPSRFKEFDDYCDDKQHSLNEAVVGLGNIDEPGDPRCLMRSVRATMKKMQELGVTIVAVDVHLDEATPHAHILWAGVTKEGKFNLDKTLDEHGVERAAPERRVIKTKNGKSRKETVKEYERRCTRQATFTAAVRQAAEDASDDWLEEHGLPKLDRERSDKQNESLSDYKARKEREEQRAREIAREDIYEELRPQVHEIKQREEKNKSKEAQLDEREESLSTREQEARRQANAAAAQRVQNAKRGEELDAREDELDEREQSIDKARTEAVAEGYEAGKAQGLAEGRASYQQAQAGADTEKKRYEKALADLGDLEAKREELSEVTGKVDAAKRELSEIAPALSGAKRTIADADAYAQKRRDEADAEADEVVRSTAKRWGGGSLKLFQTMLTVTMQFCASRSREPGDAWEQRGAVLREAMSVVDDLIGHRSERIRELFKQKFEQRLVDYDREERRKNVTYVTPTYTSPSTRQRSDREFGF